MSGKKAEIQERIRADLLPETKSKQTSGEDGFDSMTEEDIRDCLVARGLSNKGNRDQLLERLRSDITFASQLEESTLPKDRDAYMVISEALEAAAKEGGSALSQILAEVKQKIHVEPKHIDVTITSVGFEPIKFTAGGAPSVTADALRSLAGDPFADPPQYGKVSAIAVSL